MTLLRRPVVSARVLATSTVLGALAMFLMINLGLFEILGFRSYEWFFADVMGLAILVGVLGGATLLAVADALLFATHVIVAFTPIMDWAAPRWVRNDPPSDRPFDAVVVLSGWVKADSALEAVAVQRLLTGAELVKAGVAPRLITTRVIAHEDGRRIVSDFGQRTIVSLVGLQAQWTELDSVATTQHEATRTRELLLQSGGHSVAVVTSPMHTRRACAVFEGIGLTVRCVASRENVGVTWHPSSPTDRLAAFREYLYERIGMIKYKWKGWIK